mgnify:CR=1 FL=1
MAPLSPAVVLGPGEVYGPHSTKWAPEPSGSGPWMGAHLDHISMAHTGVTCAVSCRTAANDAPESPDTRWPCAAHLPDVVCGA